MLLQTHNESEGGDISTKLMAKPKVKGYNIHPSLQTTTVQYNRRNNLPIHSSQLPHDQQWMDSVLGDAIFETIKYNKNPSLAQRELRQ